MLLLQQHVDMELGYMRVSTCMHPKKGVGRGDLVFYKFLNTEMKKSLGFTKKTRPQRLAHGSPISSV
jgi:hypothetical protein